MDSETGEVLRTIESDRFVTGGTWVNGELWHGTWEDTSSDIRHIDQKAGAVLERLDMPAGTGVSALESMGATVFSAAAEAVERYGSFVSPDAVSNGTRTRWH